MGAKIPMPGSPLVLSYVYPVEKCATEIGLSDSICHWLFEGIIFENTFPLLIEVSVTPFILIVVLSLSATNLTTSPAVLFVIDITPKVFPKVEEGGI